jgi:hypothetical protein
MFPDIIRAIRKQLKVKTAIIDIGYCLSTDWHWQVKRARGETGLPNSEVLPRPSDRIKLGSAPCGRLCTAYRTGGTRPFDQPELAGLAQVRQ